MTTISDYNYRDMVITWDPVPVPERVAGGYFAWYHPGLVDGAPDAAPFPHGRACSRREARKQIDEWHAEHADR